MTQKEIYIWYCKHMGVFGNVMNMFIEKKPKKWEIGTANSIPVTFDEFFEDNLNIYGLRLIFKNMFAEIYAPYYRKFGTTEKYIKAKKKWNYFVSNNVKLDTQLNKDDVIVFKTLGHEHVGHVTVPYDGISSHIEVVYNVGGSTIKAAIKPSAIKSRNYKPLKFSYHIEKKGKKYGIKK